MPNQHEQHQMRQLQELQALAEMAQLDPVMAKKMLQSKQRSSNFNNTTTYSDATHHTQSVMGSPSHSTGYQRRNYGVVDRQGPSGAGLGDTSSLAATTGGLGVAKLTQQQLRKAKSLSPMASERLLKGDDFDDVDRLDDALTLHTHSNSMHLTFSGGDDVRAAHFAQISPPKRSERLKQDTVRGSNSNYPSNVLMQELEQRDVMNEGLRTSAAELDARLAQVRYEIKHMRSESKKFAQIQERYEPSANLGDSTKGLAHAIHTAERRNALEVEAAMETHNALLNQEQQNAQKLQKLQRKLHALELHMQSQQITLPFDSKHLSKKEMLMAAIDLEELMKAKRLEARAMKADIEKQRPQHERMLKRMAGRVADREQKLEELQAGAWSLFEKQQEIIFKLREKEQQSVRSGQQQGGTNSDVTDLQFPLEALPSSSSSFSSAITDELLLAQEIARRQRKRGNNKGDDDLPMQQSVLLLSPEDLQKERRAKLNAKKWRAEKAQRDVRDREALLDTEKKSRQILWKMFTDSIKVLRTQQRVEEMDLNPKAAKASRKENSPSVSDAKKKRTTSPTNHQQASPPKQRGKTKKATIVTEADL